MKHLNNIVLFFVLFLFAFKSRPLIPEKFKKHHKNNSLEMLKEDIDNNWHYDVASKKYLTNDSFYFKILFKRYTCLKGMDTAKFYELFGQEGSQLKLLKDYYIYYPLLADETGVGLSNENLIVVFDKNGKVTCFGMNWYVSDEELESK